jgi:hypothetical protein
MPLASSWEAVPRSSGGEARFGQLAGGLGHRSAASHPIAPLNACRIRWASLRLDNAEIGIVIAAGPIDDDAMGSGTRA